MTPPRKFFGIPQPHFSAKPPHMRRSPSRMDILVEGPSRHSEAIPYCPEIKTDSYPTLSTEIETDNWTTRRMKDIGRIGMDRFDTMGDFIASMMDVFANARRCTVYFAPSHLFSDSMNTGLEHRITVEKNSSKFSVDESGRNSQRSPYDPLMSAFMKGTPMIIDHDPGGDVEYGVRVVFQDLDRTSDRGEAFQIPKVPGRGMTAILPFYYKERDNPSGVIILEGDLRAKNSGLTGFSRTYWAASLAMSASTQISMQLIHRFDSITNLPRRLDFELDLKEGIKDLIRKGNHLYLLFIDLDNFKCVNDEYTHPVGDEVLRQAAERMQNSVRACDEVFRVGGEEFSVIVRDVVHERALEVAERIRRNVESIGIWVYRSPDGKVEIVKKDSNDQAPLPEGAELVRVTCSIGVMDVKSVAENDTGRELPPNGRGDSVIQEIFTRVYGRSAELLHEAKNCGKNCVIHECGGQVIRAPRLGSFGI